MKNEIQTNISPVQPQPQTPPVAPTFTNWSKILLFTVFGLIVVASSIFIGIQIEKNRSDRQQQIITLPTISPTELPIQIISPIESSDIFKTTGLTSNPTIKDSFNYVPGQDWHTVNNTTLGLTFCLPPKWDFTKNGDGSFSGQLIYYRDSAYAPWVAQIQSIPYSARSRREAYYAFWDTEYPDIRNLVSVIDVTINNNSALLISPSQEKESKYAPEGLTVVWHTAGKLWKANISSWSYVNVSQSAFLKDFYTAISCSF